MIRRTRPSGLHSNGWAFYAEETPAGDRRVDLLTTWRRNNSRGEFLGRTAVIIRGNGIDPSDIQKKMSLHRTEQSRHRETFFVPEV